MSATENLLELLRLARTGFLAAWHTMSPKERARAKAALRHWTGKASKVRAKLLAARNAAALRSSIEEMRPQIQRLPARCHACDGRLYYDLRPPSAQLDYLHTCRGTDTFDCALQCLRHTSTPYAGPLVPPVPKLNLPPQ